MVRHYVLVLWSFYFFLQLLVVALMTHSWAMTGMYALGVVLLGPRGTERDRLAHAVDRHLGGVQGVRRDATDLHLRGAAIPDLD